MNKAELVSDVASRAGLTSIQAERALNAAIAAITEAVSKGDSIALTGFGTFAVKHRSPRTGKNPRTGDIIEIPATNTVGFKPGKSLRDAVND